MKRYETPEEREIAKQSLGNVPEILCKVPGGDEILMSIIDISEAGWDDPNDPYAGAWIDTYDYGIHLVKNVTAEVYAILSEIMDPS